MNKKSALCSFVFFVVLLIMPTSSVKAEETINLSKGQNIYIPAYSHIYAGNRELPIQLTVTLSIRNADAKNPITITSVEYYGTEGDLISKYLDKPLVLKPFGSTRYIIPQKDTAGGSGANFLVMWQAEKPVNPALVETVMIGAESQQGISFTSRGQAITTAN